MRFLPDFRFGTEGYPEKVARRLRAVNVTAWLAALVPAFFAMLRFVQGRPAMGAVNASFAVILASLPLLHRFGPLTAALVFVVLTYAFLFRTTFNLGTDGGTFLYYLTASALVILLIGTERIVLTVVLAAAAAGLIIALHIVVPHNTGLFSPTVLFFGNFITNVIASAAILFAIVHYAVRQIARAEATAEREHERSEALLSNILPQSVGERLKQKTDAVIADGYAAASILFVDMAGFTSHASDTPPDELVQFLNQVFTRLDSLVERHGLEKIKTTGDSYMVVSGVPTPRVDHAEALADLALDIREGLIGLVDSKGRAVPIRLGIASGAVVAGVVGTRKFFYDVWGDAVNTASRMESTGEAGKIQVSPGTRELLDDKFDLEERGLINVRGKGRMRTWFLIERKPAIRSG